MNALTVCAFFAIATTEAIACGSSGSGGGATASGSGSGSPADTGIPPVSPILATLAYFWKDLKSRTTRHKGFFARRRGEAAAAAHADWVAETGQPKIIAQVQQEMDAVDAYLKKRLGTPAAPGPIMTGTGDKLPKHLDLDDAANYKVGLSLPDRRSRAAGYREMRRTRAEAIVWRATALHPELWTAAPVGLKEAILDELLDRRLRAVERMELNVNAGDASTLSPLRRSFDVTSATGPWKDGMRTRIFEYAFLPEAPFRTVLDQMTGWHRSGNQILFGPSPFPPVQIAPAIQPYWPLVIPAGWDHTTPIATIWIHYKKGARKPADVIAEMFTPNQDFAQRSWLYCDLVAAAVQIEAFWFGKHRRDGNDDKFNATLERDDYAYLGPAVNWAGDAPNHILMDDEPADPYFENQQIDLGDVEVGDELIVWNNRIYGAVVDSGAWSNEFSLIMDIDSDPQQGATGDAIWLAGHGIATQNAAGVANDLAGALKNNLDAARAAIAAKLTSDPTATEVAYLATKLVLWDPYGEFASVDRKVSPWWVKLDRPLWHNGWAFATQQEAAASIPRVIVAADPAPSGYTAPPDPGDAVYFPLFEPVFPDNGHSGDTWRSYLDSRKTGDRGTVKLRALAVDGRLATGLFYRQPSGRIAIVRPQAS